MSAKDVLAIKPTVPPMKRVKKAIEEFLRLVADCEAGPKLIEAKKKEREEIAASVELSDHTKLASIRVLDTEIEVLPGIIKRGWQRIYDFVGGELTKACDEFRWALANELEQVAEARRLKIAELIEPLFVVPGFTAQPSFGGMPGELVNLRVARESDQVRRPLLHVEKVRSTVWAALDSNEGWHKNLISQVNLLLTLAAEAEKL